MNHKTTYTLGIDIGSTTVKIAILDSQNNVLFSSYNRHFANQPHFRIIPHKQMLLLNSVGKMN